MRLPAHPVTTEQRAAAVARLRTIGGIYDHIALYVEHDHTTPALAENGDPA